MILTVTKVVKFCILTKTFNFVSSHKFRTWTERNGHFTGVLRTLLPEQAHNDWSIFTLESLKWVGW